MTNRKYLSFFLPLFYIAIVATGQNLTICRNPRLGLPCLLSCVTPRTAVQVTFIKNGNEVKSCTHLANTTDCETQRRNGLIETIMRLHSLTKFDQGYWQCSFRESMGKSVQLNPYSFERADISTPGDVQGYENQKIFTVKAHCVYPAPEFVIKYCSKISCQGKGEMFFNGVCRDEHTQSYTYSCKIDFENPSTECKSIEPVPVQALIYVNDHQVFNEFTIQLYNGKGNHDEIYIYKPLLETLSVVFVIAVIGVVAVCIVFVCKYRKRQRRPSRPSNSHDSPASADEGRESQEMETKLGLLNRV